MQLSTFHGSHRQGFALVVTLSLMILLTVIAVGLLSLSSVSLRSSSQGGMQAKARANARLALMLAIGELQKEMGPDMRVSAESALFDSDKATGTIEGMDQSHWLASYNSWGNWLNGSYSPPDSSESLKIADTYTPQREKMFRRWLLSVPDGMEKDINAPKSISSWDNTNSVVLVGPGSLGASAATDRTTRAYLTKVGKTGKYAWWVGGENQKARIDMAKKPPRTPDTAGAWETSQGDTAEVGVGVLDGFAALDKDATLGDKLITTHTLRPAQVAEAKVQQHFFDLTASSRGVLASVRTGHLKKDLSLLFEKDKSALPAPYLFKPGDVREPSIRPMSPEIANKAVLPNRHFASWTRMRHFYRMYRNDSDAEARALTNGGTDGSPGLNWDGSKPWTDCNISTITSAWSGQDTYQRFPILTNATFILSLKAELITNPKDKNSGKYNLRFVSTPVYVFWNPYNVELRMLNNKLETKTYLEQAQPLAARLYVGNNLVGQTHLQADDDDAILVTRNPSEQHIVFKPGEFRIFTPEPGNIVGGEELRILPGYDPQSFGGLLGFAGNFGPAASADTHKIEFMFSPVSPRGWLFNSQYGNTPGSFLTYWRWMNNGANTGGFTTSFTTHVDWFNRSQAFTSISGPNPQAWDFSDVLPVGYFQLVLKGIHKAQYPSIGWGQDWRCRNWIQAPPHYLGKGMYISEDPTIAQTQRMDCPFEMRFGPLGGGGQDVEDIISSIKDNAFLGHEERVTAAPSLELPTAPIGSLAGFSGMRMDPGWTDLATLNPEWQLGFVPKGKTDTSGNSLYLAATKASAYQSGITGPGIGNSFLHPMIPRTGVYQYLDNSKSMEPLDFKSFATDYKNPPTNTKAYCDYWDHVLLLNDALWDDYFVSSLADQTRPGASAGASLALNLQKLVDGEDLANSRYMPYLNGRSAAVVKDALDDEDGYLKAAAHLMVDGMFNVNSTSVDAWHALFAGIRERKLVYRDGSGSLQTVAVPSDKIALSRFNTADSNKEGNDPEFGVTRGDGLQAWSGVRFLDDDQLRKLAEECVKQVKRRGPFLNFSEFINRRLSNDELGVMGALQSAIDYDDASPDSGSINYNFKKSPDFVLKSTDLGSNSYATPEAAVGSRFAGIPGYVIQSDLLKPIANTLSVRDDTFRIRAYGEALDASGKVVIARAWCEAVVQRLPEYQDPANEPELPARLLDTSGGTFSNNSALSVTNRRFGRKFQIESFRWLSGSEI